MLFGGFAWLCSPCNLKTIHFPRTKSTTEWFVTLKFPKPCQVAKSPPGVKNWPVVHAMMTKQWKMLNVMTQGTETIGKYIPSMSINNPVTPCHNSVWQAHEQNMWTNQLVKQSCFAGMRIWKINQNVPCAAHNPSISFKRTESKVAADTELLTWLRMPKIASMSSIIIVVGAANRARWNAFCSIASPSPICLH